MVQIHPDSHSDHLSSELKAFVATLFNERKGFFIETVTLPEGLTASCALYGPCMGDDPIPYNDVTYKVRPGRKHPSRTISAPEREVKTLTIIAGGYEDKKTGEKFECILHTAFGGPLSSKEVNDPYLGQGRGVLKNAIAFWNGAPKAGGGHALAL